MAKTIELCRCTHLLPHLIYVNALPCETQMLQIVTLRGGYLYRIAYLCIINSTEGAKTTRAQFLVLSYRNISTIAKDVLVLSVLMCPTH